MTRVSRLYIFFFFFKAERNRVRSGGGRELIAGAKVWGRMNWWASKMTGAMEKSEQRLWNISLYGRQEGQSHLKPWNRLTSLADEEMATCLWEPLFALVPIDGRYPETICHKNPSLPHRVRSPLPLPLPPHSLPLPRALYHGQATWILSRDEAKLVCKLSQWNQNLAKTSWARAEKRAEGRKKIARRRWKTGLNAQPRASWVCFNALGN